MKILHMKHKKDVQELVKLSLIIILAVQFCLIMYSNLTMIEKNLDCDTGKLFNHIAEIWRQKQLLLPNWDYLTTLEWDCSSLFALPFYVLTGDIILSFGMANILCLGGFLYIVFYLFKGEDALYPLLCANLLIIPYRVGMLDYYNMLFFGGAQYIIKASLPLILIGIIIRTEYLSTVGGMSVRKWKNIIPQKTDVSDWIISVVYLALVLLTSISSGPYVIVCGLFPACAVYIGYKFWRWEKVPFYTIILMIMTVILALTGWKVNEIIMDGARGNNMNFCSVYQLLGNVASCFFGMFELFGGATENTMLPILSVAGIQLLAKCGLVLIMLVAGVAMLVQWKKEVSLKAEIGQSIEKNQLRPFLLISVFVWNLFILNVTNTRGGSSTYEYRYHLIGMLPLLCATVIFILRSIQSFRRKQQQICLYCGGILFLLLLCLTSYKDLYSREEQNGQLKEFCAYVKDFDVEYIYLFEGSNDVDMCRVIDETSTYICLLDTGRTWAYDYYKQYVDGPVQTENVIVAVDIEKYSFGDTFEYAGYELEKFDSVAKWELYVFKEP